MLTAQERKIARQLGGVYLVYGCVVSGVYMVGELGVGSIPQWITAGVAVAAGVVALINLRLSRKRAAIDFFLKTEADKELLQSWDNFWVAVKKLENAAIDEFCNPANSEFREHYFAIRRYLNLHELLAVSIKTRMFDYWTCHNFWSLTLLRCVRAARPVIDHVRARPGREITYLELVGLFEEWDAIQKRAIKLAQ
jgi:hypothetical protein